MRLLNGLLSALLALSTAYGDERPRVAVVEMNVGAGVTDGEARMVTEAVSGWLISSGRVVVVDRENLDRVMKEQVLQLSGVINNADLVKVGNLAGVQVFVMGEASATEENWAATLKLLVVETGSVTNQVRKSYHKADDWHQYTMADFCESFDFELMMGDLFPRSASDLAASEERERKELLASIPPLNKEVSGVEVGEFTDARDGKVYQTVTIGDQTWMAVNLAYKDVKGMMRGRGPYGPRANGLYYNWKAAHKACPNGWHLPTADEFEELKDYLVDEYNEDLLPHVGYYLKSTEGWQSVAGNDPFGFRATPSGEHQGHKSFDGTWDGIGEYATYWTASKEKGRPVYFQLGGCYDAPNCLSSSTRKDHKRYYYSVRYIRD